jgi:agmatine deiminase
MEENLERLKGALDEDGKPFKIVRMPLPPPMFQTVTPPEPVYDLYKNSLIYEDTPEGKEAQAWVYENKPLRVIIAASYCNFLITNGVVIAAKYHKAKDPVRSHKKFQEADLKAKEILQSLFPDRKIVQIDCFAFNLGGGGFHCTSQQQPL